MTKYFTPVFIIVLLLSACAGQSEPTQIPSINNNVEVTLTHVVATNVTNAPAPIITPSMPSATPSIKSTPEPPVWEEVESWTFANKIRVMLIDQSGDLWTGGPAGIVHWNLETGKPTIYALRDDPENANVTGLSQTPDGVIWASTFGNGLAKFDGTSWQPFTTENGLPSNYIVSQTITARGELWFTVRNDKYSIEGLFGRLSDNKWISEKGGAFDHIVALPNGSIVGTYNFPYSSGFFPSTIAVYDGQIWNVIADFPYHYIDAITVAPDGAAWIATNESVSRIVGRTLHKISLPWVGKNFPRVSSIAISGTDVAWFGFSHNALFDMDSCSDLSDKDEEQGVYRYDGKTWTHFTADDGLVDNKICEITVDASENTWFGSFDKGVSRFDGHEWKSYVIP